MVVVDCIDGLRIADRAVLRHSLVERVNLCLIVNKVD